LSLLKTRFTLKVDLFRVAVCGEGDWAESLGNSLLELGVVRNK